MVVLTIKAKHDHLQKVASTRDYIKAISEFVWNALDADAKRTSVDLVRNALGGLESIVIRDNGSGISRARAEHDFESLGESWKLTTARTPLLGRAIHGKEGQGRLRFFSLARRAHWSSVYAEGQKRFRLTIDIDADHLETSNVSEPTAIEDDAETVTIVELAPLKDTFDWLKLGPNSIRRLPHTSSSIQTLKSFMTPRRSIPREQLNAHINFRRTQSFARDVWSTI